MIVLAALIIVVLTVAYIAYPVVKRLREGVEVAAEDDSLRKLKRLNIFTENEELEELYSQRDATYSAIEELEFDVKSGTLSNKDSDELKQSYKAKAVSILKEIDDKEKGAGLDGDIERQIQQLRQGETIYCPQCGEQCREDDKFCVQCGAELHIERLE